MRQGRVYVVDDDASVRKGLSRILAALGYAVECCADGSSFIEAVQGDAPSCALVDVCLAGTSGFDVLAALGNRRIDIPVIFITGNPAISTCVRAMKAGVVDFLLKPLRKDELAQAIGSAHLVSINRQHARNESQRSERLLACLTVRERQVLGLVLEGRRNKEIAATLDSQEATVKVHRSRLMRKLGVRSVPDLVRIGDSGNLAALLLRDREPADAVCLAPSSVCETRLASARDPADPENAWFAADGTWSGFTWRPGAARVPPHH